MVVDINANLTHLFGYITNISNNNLEFWWSFIRTKWKSWILMLFIVLHLSVEGTLSVVSLSFPILGILMSVFLPCDLL